MIRVNLIGGAKKPAGDRRKKGSNIALPTTVLPVIWVVILVAAAFAGWSWWSGLVGESEGLTAQIEAATAQRDQLQSVIAENEVFEGRQEMLQNRIDTIQDLQRNQVSPVVVLDELSQAIGQVDYVWLSSLTQNDTTVTIAGTGTSQVAVADFITSLENTGYFRDINLGNVQEAAGGLFTFSLAFTFVPPPLAD